MGKQGGNYVAASLGVADTLPVFKYGEARRFCGTFIHRKVFGAIIVVQGYFLTMLVNLFGIVTVQ